MTSQIDDLIKRVGEINESHGFNEYKDIPDDYKKFYIGTKILLMVSELTEAFEEIRSGKPTTETYYVMPAVPASLIAEVGDVDIATKSFEDFWKNQPGLKKPEGFPSELADALIRLLSLVYEIEQDKGEVIPLVEAVEEKIAYNDTRPYKHGRQF